MDIILTDLTWKIFVDDTSVTVHKYMCENGIWQYEVTSFEEKEITLGDGSIQTVYQERQLTREQKEEAICRVKVITKNQLEDVIMDNQKDLFSA